MRKQHWIGFFSLLLLLVSCAPRQVVKEENLTAADVLRRVVERNNAVQTLQGRGNISVDSPELSNSGAFHVSIKKPDSLLLVLRGPFGIHVGTLSLTPQSFQFYNGLENTLLTGVPDSTTLLDILHIQLPVERILDAFSGAFAIVQDSLLRYAATEEEYLMAFTREGLTTEYRIDTDTFIITDYLVKDREDKVLFKAEASRITNGSDISTPEVLRISFPDDARSISLVYKEISLNEDVNCSFTRPEGATIIRK